ncbi:hypothetical protein CMO91_01625 [Candidatus Woesearchaeota archaeon]|nr:hypothetical protein [Candidatus Woesearchaeota archaeon]
MGVAAIQTFGCHTAGKVRSTVLPFTSHYFPNTLFESREAENVTSMVFQRLYDATGKALSPQQQETYMRSKWDLRRDRRGDEHAMKRGKVFISLWEARRVLQMWDKQDHMKAVEELVREGKESKL